MRRTEPLLDGPSKQGIHSTPMRTDPSQFKWRGLFDRILPPAYQQEIKLMTMAWPVAMSSTLEQLMLAVITIFTGNLGKAQLDASGLGNSIIDMGGFAVICGLNAASDTLFSQTYGSKQKRNLGVLLQRAILINALMCIPCCAFFINAGNILSAVGVDPEVTRLTAVYLVIFAATLPGLALLMVLSKYLFAQNIVRPTFVILVLSNVFNVICLHIFLNWFQLDILGAGMSLCLTYWSSSLMHVIYIYSFNVHKTMWSGWHFDCLLEWKTFFNLAVPGLLMLCVPWAGYEIFMVTAGLLGTTELAVHAVLCQISALVDTLPLGFATAAGMRVGNLLGSGDYKTAKRSASVAILLAGGLYTINGALLMIFSEPVINTFTKDNEVRQLATRLFPAVVVHGFFISISFVAGGVLRGMGRQKFGAIISSTSIYVIALPLGIPLMFKTELRLAGCWVGLVLSAFSQDVANLSLISCTDWKNEAILAKNRTKGCVYGNTTGYKDYQPIVRQDLSSESEDDTDENPSTNGDEIMHTENKFRIIASRLVTLLAALGVLVAGIVVRITSGPDMSGGFPEKSNCSLTTMTFNISK